jgi:signal transduction histidine kinase
MLAGSSSEPLDVAVAQAVEDVAHRLGARIEIDAEPTPAVEPRLQEQLLRIAREAVTNAGRHGRAELVRVELSNGNGLRLRIVDDGIGFDPTAFAENGEGFGLVTMRERAHSVGGQLRIVSARNRGTEVEVVIP